jgi:FkbM family methyltransferase
MATPNDSYSSRINPILASRKINPNQPPFVFNTFRYGVMIYYYYDIYVSGSLEQYGEWSQLEIDFMCNFLEEGDTVVDAGAFIGTHTLAFSRKVGITGKVYAFEPTKESFCCLAGNLMINNLYKTEVFQLALGKRNGILDLIDIGNVTSIDNYGGIGAVEYHPSWGKAHKDRIKKVEMRTLDSFNIDQCKLIKIDAEGMSLDVLKGAKATIKKCRPSIFAEVDEPEPGSGISIEEVTQNKKLIEFMKNFGYNVYDATSMLFNPNNYFNNSNNIFGNTVSFAVFCCPKDWNIEGLRDI